MPHGRHRVPGLGRVAPARCDSGGIALTVLAVLGLAGPAWTLRDQATNLLSVDRPTAISVPDTAEPET
ncbi:hypothetical protein [Streptomyces sp. CBMA152]|uniref:hypothetical protein n=1 Tax=Streptomyces sp. CBMA152 TaxID=1896312 RepID=UPI0016608719|nr:hypothetical protein [Streptomyces sp. CBMA152]MBD0743982.1 hypothetical protein [Streptomyces sp. CBMA152]